MPLLAPLLERLAAAVETSSTLDPVADALQAVTTRIPAGTTKDLLSGTPIGHPLHPVLVTVPIGAWVGATALDLTGADAGAARRLVGFGILSSLPTALTGSSDWSDTMGAERRVGIAHAVLNSAALGLMAASWLARREPGRGKLLALAGVTLVGASGWLGGHLSYALGVGVDTTAFEQPPSDWTDACALDDLTDGRPKAVTVGDLPVLLVSRGGRVTAIGNRCTHRGAPLSDGQVVGDCIECPWHGSRFDLATGQVERGPATRPQPELAVRVLDGRVQVRKDEERSLRTNPVS